MESNNIGITQKVVKVSNIRLDFCKSNEENSKEIILKLAKGWTDILAEKGDFDNEYFGIVVSSGEDNKLGVVIKKDNLYLQGIFDCDKVYTGDNGIQVVNAYISDSDIRYKDCYDGENKYISPEFISVAIAEGKCSIEKKKIYEYLHSYNFVKLIFAVSEAARFESVRTAIVIGIAIQDCKELTKINVAEQKGLYNVSEKMVLSDLLDFANYNDLKKIYGDIINYGKKSFSCADKKAATKGYATISMSQVYLGNKYLNTKHKNDSEMDTYKKIGLMER